MDWQVNMLRNGWSGVSLRSFALALVVAMPVLQACDGGDTASSTSNKDSNVAAQDDGSMDLVMASGAIGDVEEKPSAALSLEIDPVGYLFTEGRHRFTQTRRFVETAGIGVTLVKGRVCVSNGTECVEAALDRRIDANTELVMENHYVATSTLPDTALVEYYGLDDNGNQLILSQEMSLKLPE